MRKIMTLPIAISDYILYNSKCQVIYTLSSRMILDDFSFCAVAVRKGCFFVAIHPQSLSDILIIAYKIL